jgi:hypothetical protein
MVSDTSARPRAWRFCGAGEDDVVHLLGAHRARCLGAEHPADGVDHVGLADPLGPTTTVTPGSIWSVVASAKDLNPLMVSDFRNTGYSMRPGPVGHPTWRVAGGQHRNEGPDGSAAHWPAIDRGRTGGAGVAGPKVIKGYRLEAFAQCSGAQLDHARLNAANLYSIDLRGASLREAKLAGAHIAEARLAGADLSGADLTGANLSGADLQRANLVGADLSGANLRRANLTGARTSGVTWVGARFCKTMMPDLRVNDMNC